MTDKTSKNSLTILLGLAIIASVAVTSTITVSYAWHDFLQPTWSGATHTYKCMSSLDTLGDTYVDECGDLDPSSDVWNVVANSNWDLSENASTGEIEISGANLGTAGIAKMTATVSWGTITDAQIEFNNQEGWTDALFTASSTDYDYESVAIHEMGHLLKLADDSDTNSPMHGQIDPDVVRRTLTTHDKAAIAGQY
ncbi:matrixin family metalloprotease [archaeon]|nr:matrixin family metalloprotease [archaeon]